MHLFESHLVISKYAFTFGNTSVVFYHYSEKRCLMHLLRHLFKKTFFQEQTFFSFVNRLLYYRRKDDYPYLCMNKPAYISLFLKQYWANIDIILLQIIPEY